MELFKEVLIILYYISNIFLVIGVFIAISQLKLQKKVTQTANKREAINKSIEYLNIYATECIPISSEIAECLKENGIDNNTWKISKDFRFNDKFKKDKGFLVKYIRSLNGTEPIDLLNKLEVLSTAFNSGLADERLAFNPLSKIYCNTIRNLYPLICILKDNDDSDEGYSNIIKLYGIWEDRRNKIKIEKELDDLIKKMSTIEDKGIEYLGEKIK